MFMHREMGCEYDYSLDHILLDSNNPDEKSLSDVIEDLINMNSPEQVKLMIFDKTDHELSKYANSP